MLVELIIGAFIVFGLGSYVGLEKGKEAAKQEQVQAMPPNQRPERWNPAQHEEMIRTCAISCGEGRFQKYNTLYGTCECKDVDK